MRHVLHKSLATIAVLLMLMLQAPSAWAYDFIATAPFSTNGTTVAAGDNCGLRAGDDVTYAIFIPHSGTWTFSLCATNPSWDTYLYLSTQDCGGTVLALSDDYCSVLSSISYTFAEGGYYFLDIEPFSNGATGAFTLDVTFDGPALHSASIVQSSGVGCGGGTFTVNGAYYLTSLGGEPWGATGNVDAMDAVFGAGKWTPGYFEGVNPEAIFSNATSFVFLEGSNYGASELETFINENHLIIEQWVSNGGRLFINAAPNEGANQNWYFGGVQLNAIVPEASATALAPVHPIFAGPFTPCTTSFTGNSFAHGYFTGPGFTNLMNGPDGPVISTLNLGAGLVFFGSMTTPNWHTPAAEAQNLRQNILAHVSGQTAQSLYLWSTGETSQSIFINAPGDYSVTVQYADGSTGNASYHFGGEAMAISPSITPPFCPGQALSLTVSGAERVFYLHSLAGEPWGQSSNTDALNAVFGNGGWTLDAFETAVAASIFTNTTKFVFLEGSDYSADELNAFFSTNQTLIENWVAAGGKLFINAAPNEGSNQSWGFGGVTLTYPNLVNTGVAVFAHPIFDGPFAPITTSYTGGSFAHASVSGGQLTPVIYNGSTLYSLAYTHWGNGMAFFGAMTTANFHAPGTEAQNLRQNILAYLGGRTTGGTYAWSNGANTQTIGVTAGLDTYVVTVTAANGCVSTASYTPYAASLGILEIPPMVSHCPGDEAQLDALVIGNAYYLTSANGEPWGSSCNTDAMNAVFGNGSWGALTFETADPYAVFNPATMYVFLEGSDSGADELNTFMTNNLSIIENWIADGGTMFINAAPNEGGDQNWGFGGVTLHYLYPNTASSNGFAAYQHPIFNGPISPVVTSYTGTSYSHAFIDGGGVTSIMDGDAGSIFAYKQWGLGSIYFGGMTTTNWHSPATEAQNLRVNMVFHVAANYSAGYSFLWNNGATTQIATVTAGGTYTVTATSPNGCTTTATYTINYLPAPVATVSQNGMSLETGPFTAYQWAYNGVPIAGATNQTYAPTQNGSYTVVVTDANGCTGSSAPFNVVFVGMTNLTREFRLYPNPATSVVQLEGVPVNATLTLYNALGQPVLNKIATTDQETIERGNLPAGVYSLEIHGDTMKGTYRIVFE